MRGLSYKLFVSHSFRDTALVRALQSLNVPGIELYIAEDDPRYGERVSAKIESELDSSDAVVVFLTKNGKESDSVNQEIGYAKKANKLIVAMVEHDQTVGVLLQGIEVIHFSTDKVEDALKRVIRYLKPKAEKKERLGWMILGVIISLILIPILIALMLFLRGKTKRS